MSKFTSLSEVVYFQSWAKYLRPKTHMMPHLHTNNGVEAMHRVIKHEFELAMGRRYSWVRLVFTVYCLHFTPHLDLGHSNKYLNGIRSYFKLSPRI